MLYVVHAYDYTDEQALERRMSVRERHLEGAKILKTGGHFVMGGALLSPEGLSLIHISIARSESAKPADCRASRGRRAAS